ncbi:MAG: outer membrane beta-barrel protein [Pseudobdellovibrio sp.]
MHSLGLRKILLLVLFCVSLFHQHAHAQSNNDVDEGFDPFSDYNEVEQSAEEEADINFFKNGRFLTIGALIGYRGYTDGFSQAYSSAVSWGVQFSYFFDLQTAISLSYSTADSGVDFFSFNDANFTSVSQHYTGTVNIQTFDINAKYYFNTENVTKGLAELNPYVLLGFGQFTRTYNLSRELPLTPDKPIGFKIGTGIEIPIMRHKAYIGLQALYHFVQFPDENNDRIEETKPGVADPVLSPVKPRLNGDIYELQTILGFNF